MANLFRLDNQVAVVIGGAGGIGEALGHGLAEYGAKTVIADVDLQRAEQVAQDILANHKDSEAIAYKFDITDEHSVAALRDNVIAQIGRAHV